MGLYLFLIISLLSSFVIALSSEPDASRTDFFHCCIYWVSVLSRHRPDRVTECERAKIELAPAARASINQNRTQLGKISSRFSSMNSARKSDQMYRELRSLLFVCAHKKPTTVADVFDAARTLGSGRRWCAPERYILL